MVKCGHTLCLRPDQQCPSYVAEKAVNLDKLVTKYESMNEQG